MNCSRCDKRLSRKSARLINGKLLCSMCLFAPSHPKWGFYDDSFLGRTDYPKRPR